MGFWSTLGKVARSLGDTMVDSNEEVQEHVKILRQSSDAELVNMLQHSSKLGMSINERSAIQKVLRDRYSNDEKHNQIIHQHWDTSESPISKANRWLR